MRQTPETLARVEYLSPGALQTILNDAARNAPDCPRCRRPRPLMPLYSLDVNAVWAYWCRHCGWQITRQQANALLWRVRNVEVAFRGD